MKGVKTGEYTEETTKPPPQRGLGREQGRTKLVSTALWGNKTRSANHTKTITLTKL
jgi:hypothetical protein